MILGFAPVDLVIFIAISLLICVTVCTLAMEASVLFTPAFLFLFPLMFANFPDVTPNEAIGLAITIEFFGYTSSVIGYWYRGQVDFRLALRVLAWTVPLAVVGRVAAYFVAGDGLVLIFGIVLLGLAAIIFRAYQGEVRHTCLLCGDSLMAMKYSDKEEAEPVAERPFAIVFNALDRFIMMIGGAFGGMVGVAIGEISNTFLTVRKQVPIKVATGTSALILHITILSALGANLLVLWGDFDFIEAEDISIPWVFAFILAPVVIVGGQIGSFVNSRLSDRTLIRAMMIAYTGIGCFILGRVMAG